MMSASTIDEFKALVLNYPGLTFGIFGNGTQDDLNELKKELFPTSLMSRYQLQDLWARHPLRQGQKKWCVLFRKGILIQHLILSDNLIAI